MAVLIDAMMYIEEGMLSQYQTYCRAPDKMCKTNTIDTTIVVSIVLILHILIGKKNK